MNPLEKTILKIRVLNVIINEFPGAFQSRILGGFSLKAILNRNSSRELDLSLCTFNYTRLAGLQPPES